jgi:hypothetical protein
MSAKREYPECTVKKAHKMENEICDVVITSWKQYNKEIHKRIPQQ